MKARNPMKRGRDLATVDDVIMIVKSWEGHLVAQGRLAPAPLFEPPPPVALTQVTEALDVPEPV